MEEFIKDIIEIKRSSYYITSDDGRGFGWGTMIRFCGFYDESGGNALVVTNGPEDLYFGP